MSEFVFLYRLAPGEPVSAQVMQQRMQVWMSWMKDLESKGHLVGAGHPLAQTEGAVVKKGSFSDGPYAETKDIVIGYTLIRAKDLDEAKRLAAGCPILEGPGMVEVRPIAKM